MISVEFGRKKSWVCLHLSWNLNICLDIGIRRLIHWWKKNTKTLQKSFVEPWNLLIWFNSFAMKSITRPNHLQLASSRLDVIALHSPSSSHFSVGKIPFSSLLFEQHLIWNFPIIASLHAMMHHRLSWQLQLTKATYIQYKLTRTILTSTKIKTNRQSVAQVCSVAWRSMAHRLGFSWVLFSLTCFNYNVLMNAQVQIILTRLLSVLSFVIQIDRCKIV